MFEQEGKKQRDDRVRQITDFVVYIAGRIKKDHQALSRYIVKTERNKSILWLSMFPMDIYT